MTKDKDIKTVVPTLRFPEFRNTEGWEITQLSKLGATVSGLTYTPTDIRDSGLLVLRSSNIKDSRIALDDCVYVTENIRGANISHPNDILICVRNGSASLIGKNAIIPYNMPLCTHGAFMTVFRAKNPAFVYQLFQTDTYQNQVNADLGARINSINNGQLNEYKFAVPKLNEQQKIADCLGSLDDLIIAIADKIEVLKEHKKGLTQQLFPADGKTTPALRFPEFQNAPDWEETTLGDIGEIVTGNTPSTKDSNNYGGDKLFVSPADISDKRYVSQTKTTVSDKGFRLSRHIKENSILFVCIGSTIGKVAQNTIECATNQQINSVIPYKNYVADFVYSILEYYAPKIASVAGKQAVPIIKKTLFASVSLLIPQKDEQQKIADCLSSIDKLISAETNKLDQLKFHKKGLMQQLFPTLNE